MICRTIVKDKQSMFWNAISKLEDKKDLINDTIVKCYISKNKNILFCSRKEEIIKNRSKYSNYEIIRTSSF